jgi:hypothetical protein
LDEDRYWSSVLGWIPRSPGLVSGRWHGCVRDKKVPSPQQPPLTSRTISPGFTTQSSQRSCLYPRNSPRALRSESNTPGYVPSTFPHFPPKYTYSFTPSFPPRAVDPETIRSRGVGGGVWDVGMEKREEIWWETWRKMGCDVERGLGEVWPMMGKMRRRGKGSM